MISLNRKFSMMYGYHFSPPPILLASDETNTLKASPNANLRYFCSTRATGFSWVMWLLESTEFQPVSQP